ncbi:hypothetical protein [Kibdelosporangium phytohabitans]|uniref:hypothetical protein n=1 Tax=Kibdelosporangium phytohabitans TaxID=860235 RepID=UPI0012FBAE66|nr:hypothetical protein [Kibdelosporangium phytohabitans]MBE1469138.1 hypothetical protein [Kibdelosporangium phytohabitans]
MPIPPLPLIAGTAAGAQSGPSPRSRLPRDLSNLDMMRRSSARDTETLDVTMTVVR